MNYTTWQEIEPSTLFFVICNSVKIVVINVSYVLFFVNTVHFPAKYNFLYFFYKLLFVRAEILKIKLKKPLKFQK